MELPKRKSIFLNKMITHWNEQGLIDDEKTKELTSSYSVSKFDWKHLTKYSFWIAAISFAIAFGALFFDEAILKLVEEFLQLPEWGKALLLSAIAAGFFIFGFLRKKSHPDKHFSNEFILFIGAIFTAGAVFFTGTTFDDGSGNFPILILISALIYLAIGIAYPSRPLWVIGLLSLGSWLGLQTGYVSGWGAYYMGMNYPVRILLLGIVFVGTYFVIKPKLFSSVRKSTFRVGQLYIFLSLWLLSIWGNFEYRDYWEWPSVTERLVWSLVFGGAALACIVYGLKSDDRGSRNFGISFLFLNLYTKYFEFFWDSMHKVIFFLVMGVSFFIIGRYGEKIWKKVE